MISEHFFGESSRILAPFDLNESDSVHALRMFRSLVHGFSVLEHSDGFGLPEDAEESFKWMLEKYTESLDNT